MIRTAYGRGAGAAHRPGVGPGGCLNRRRPFAGEPLKLRGCARCPSGILPSGEAVPGIRLAELRPCRKMPQKEAGREARLPPGRKPAVCKASQGRSCCCPGCGQVALLLSWADRGPPLTVWLSTSPGKDPLRQGSGGHNQPHRPRGT